MVDPIILHIKTFVSSFIFVILLYLSQKIKLEQDVLNDFLKSFLWFLGFVFLFSATAQYATGMIDFLWSILAGITLGMIFQKIISSKHTEWFETFSIVLASFTATFVGTLILGSSLFPEILVNNLWLSNVSKELPYGLLIIGLVASATGFVNNKWGSILMLFPTITFLGASAYQLATVILLSLPVTTFALTYGVISTTLYSFSTLLILASGFAESRKIKVGLNFGSASLAIIQAFALKFLLLV